MKLSETVRVNAIAWHVTISVAADGNCDTLALTGIKYCNSADSTGGVMIHA